MEIRRFNFCHFVWPHFFARMNELANPNPLFSHRTQKQPENIRKSASRKEHLQKMQRNNTRLQRKIRKQNNKNTQKSPKPCFEIKIINIDNQTRVFHFEKLQTGSKFEIQTKLENKQVFETEPF